jgi:hypothetical protein
MCYVVLNVYPNNNNNNNNKVKRKPLELYELAGKKYLLQQQGYVEPYHKSSLTLKKPDIGNIIYFLI